MASSSQAPTGGGEMVLNTNVNSNGEEDAASATRTSQWPGPGIFVKVEFGVSFSPTNMRRLSFNYASRNIGNQMVAGRSGIRRPTGAPGPLSSHPLSLMPGEGGSRWGDGERTGQERPGRRRIRSRSAMQMRTTNSPVSPLSPPVMRHGHAVHTQHHSYSSEAGTNTSSIDNIFNNNPYAVSSPVDLHYPSYTAFTAGPSTCTMETAHPLRIRQSTIDRKPLPPLPNRFRLGEEELPWSSPMSFAPTESSFTPPTALGLARSASNPSEGGDGSRNEDPARRQELATLGTAMMTVDSIEGEDWRSSPAGWRGWEGPGGVGWAVRIEDQADAWEQERLRGRERRERVTRTGDDFRGWYGDELERSPWSPPPAYEGSTSWARGTWGWEWEWEERAGYWVRTDLRRSYSR